MFPGRIRNPAIVEAGLPSLLEQMKQADITTPRRVAAFLTTLAFESRLEYNIREIGDTRRYGGRGYIQLTGRALPDGDVMNYGPCGRHLGIDLINNPDLAMSLEWSAKIARWYWTVARPSCNAYADALRMGKINAAIGYPRSPDGSNDQARCLAFQAALKYLTGVVEPVDCAR